MIRIVEVLVALLIVFVLAVVVGVLLPSHGHVERTVEVSSPLRQVYDSVNTFRRYPQWSGLRSFDPSVQMTLAGPEAGPGAKVSWNSASPKIGAGNLEIVSTEQDSKVGIKIDNDWAGENKTYTVTLLPQANGKTVKINVAYDVDYGWNLMWRFAGLYINGDPSAIIQSSLNNLSAMLAGFPNTDYKDQDIRMVEVVGKPMLLVETRAPRTLDDVSISTETALTAIHETMTKVGLEASGPITTITTNWGEEEYEFIVGVPVNSTTFMLADQTYTIEVPVAKSVLDEPEEEQEAEEGEPAPLTTGQKDDSGFLVVEGPVRAAIWYGGRALYTEYTGSPAALPLLRLNQKAYAETHGYKYSEYGLGRFWDEMVSPSDVMEGEQTFRVYLPIQQ
jgi:uncharacterized protein YndB with AHSA1/START domain